MDNGITRLSVPANIVFGRAHFDDGRQPQSFADLMFVDPTEPYTLNTLGIGTRFSGSPMWLQGQHLPGIPFGSAVARKLPKSVLESVMAGEGRAFTDLEVADFLRPVLDDVARGLVVLAGVAEPPSADPEYVAFSVPMLSHWEFIAGEDRAIPLTAGAVPYVALRIFTPVEFVSVQRHGGKLRPIAAETATLQPKSAAEELAAEWMRLHVTKYVANQRDDRVSECASALNVKKPIALAGWNALPEAIRGRSRVSK